MEKMSAIHNENSICLEDFLLDHIIPLELVL